MAVTERALRVPEDLDEIICVVSHQLERGIFHFQDLRRVKQVYVVGSGAARYGLVLEQLPSRATEVQEKGELTYSRDCSKKSRSSSWMFSFLPVLSGMRVMLRLLVLLFGALSAEPARSNEGETRSRFLRAGIRIPTLAREAVVQFMASPLFA